ncbi:disease resistance protein Roq1 isoform X2 [Cryptomeria japonica]|uniref:disease resistance protein Roq1 isoform X2 n=1 Tax=Cryptomeria japonica TaxID=3369 RepID=UPI0027DA3C5A|nr:disease resistance protein Roq1 isoform X2 [Cryptomeria japonica]
MANSSSLQEIVECDAFDGIAPAHLKGKSATSPRLFDVFINHRGPDVKHTLALQLHKSLTDLGLKVFLDSEEMELGEAFPCTVHDAICSSLVHIAIFSKRYAESAWCLAELDLMLHTKCKIIPVFYDVAPLHLRHIEKGVYAESFFKHKEKGRYLSKLEQWKQSLHTVSFISGYEPNENNCDLEKMCKMVVSAVRKEVEKTNLLEVAKCPVGLNELVEDFKSWLCLNAKESGNILGIYGMGGIGKTTLAKELYNLKRSEYKASCFLFDVREASARRDMPSLQSKLLKDLGEENHPKFCSQEEGKTYLKNRLGKRRAFLRCLVVVDDIDHPDQLGALLVMDMLSTDSLAIVTTRDESVLVQAGITARYRVKEMNPIYSRQLFCCHAFGRPDPNLGYEDLVERFVKGCGGLPLSLQVIGRLVFGRNDKQYWELTLDKVRNALPGDIKQILQISSETLDREQQQIFMDIACFFIGEETNMAIKIWDRSGWHAEHSLQMLKEKCLVEEESSVNKFKLRMHDHLRDLGREMADDSSHPRRIWRPQHLSTLELEGLKKILATTKYSAFRCLNSIFDRSIGSQITYFLGNRDDRAETSTALLWLELDLNWDSYRRIPSWIPLQNLQSLKIKRGHVTRLWQRNLQATFNLKTLLLASMREFTKSLEMLPHLEHLALQGIAAYHMENSERERRMKSSLKNLFLTGGLVIEAGELSKSLRKLTNLRILVLRDCILIGTLAFNSSGSELTDIVYSQNSCTSSLEIIKMYNVKQISKVSISGKHCPRLESLHLVSMESLIELNITGVTTPHFLALEDCKRLERVSGNFYLAKLVILDCPKLQELPSLANSRFLESISVARCRWLLIGGLPTASKYQHYHADFNIKSFLPNECF